MAEREAPAPPLVDYERAAECYDAGRALSSETLARWREAVGRRLPDGQVRVVVDVGAGTGIFLGLWLELGAGSVLAVEPSPAMRTRTRTAARNLPGVEALAATGSNLPVRTASVDVAWLSAVVHHLGDLDLAAVELRRVLRPGGHVLIRGFAPDRSTFALLDHLPDPELATTRFPTTGSLSEALDRAGLAVMDIVNVTDDQRWSGDEAAAWVTAMRDADSILTALPDDHIAAAVASLRSVGTATLPPTALTLVTAVAAAGTEVARAARPG